MDLASIDRGCLKHLRTWCRLILLRFITTTAVYASATYGIFTKFKAAVARFISLNDIAFEFGCEVIFQEISSVHLIRQTVASLKRIFLGALVLTDMASERSSNSKSLIDSRYRRLID